MSEIKRKKIYVLSRKDVIIVLGALISAGLFIQHTIVLGNWYTKTTISDLVLPFIIVAMAARMKEVNIQVSRWGFKVFAILAFILLWLFIAFINGYIGTGILISWAWGTKLMGFFILIAYMCIGAVISIDNFARKILVKTYVYTSYFVAACSYTRFLWEVNSADNIGSIAWRPIGFSENPNALAFILGSSLIIQIAGSKEIAIQSRWANIGGLAFIIAIMSLTGSRSTYLGMMFIIPLLIVYRKDIRWKKMLASGLIATLLLFNCSLDYSPIAKHIKSRFATTSVARESVIDWRPIGKLNYAKRNPLVVDSGVKHRWEMTKIGLDVWAKNPIVGGGLGSFMVEYENKTGSSSVLHTSIVWLVVETGIIGLFAFTALIRLIIKRAWSKSKKCNGWEYKITCLLILYSFGASLGTEILYQRQIWFMLGVMMCNEMIKLPRHRIIKQ